MRNKNLTEEEQELKAFMAISSITYFVVGLTFILRPEFIWNKTNYIFFRFIEFLPESVSALFVDPGSQNMEYEWFWLVLASAMMMAISAISFIAYKDIRNNKSIIPALLIAKLISSSSGFLFFSKFDKYPLLLLVGLVDGFLFLITLFFYARAHDEKKRNDLLYFSNSQYVIVNKAARTVIPLKEGEEVDVALAADRFFYKTKSHFFRDFTPLLITAFEWFPFLVLFIPFTRFTVLSEDLQEKFINKISTSRIRVFRLFFFAVKSVLMQGYYGSEKTWEEIEYSGPWVKEKAKEGV